MSRDEQFTMLFLLIANIWLVGTMIARTALQQGICALAGTVWCVAALIGALS